MTPDSLRLPVLALRDLVFLPGMVLPLLVGRSRSVRALEKARDQDGILVMVAQRSADVDDPREAAELFQVATRGRILEAEPLSDGTWRVVFEGLDRVRLELHPAAAPDAGLEGTATPFPYEEAVPSLPAAFAVREAVAHRVARAAREYVHLHPDLPADLAHALGTPSDRVRMLHLVAGHLALPQTEKQALLEVASIDDALGRLSDILEREIAILRIENRLDHEMQTRRRDLGALLPFSFPDQGPSMEPWHDLESRLGAAALPPAVRDRADREFQRLIRLNPSSPEAGVLRGYLEWICDLPWTSEVIQPPSLRDARVFLEEAHFGLEEVKDRILDHLAVLSLVSQMPGPVLCLVGPPGVGKTSLGKSIAQALGRQFVRVALGGIRDEAEIRGHRRTYVGSLPGRVLQGMRRAGVGNPVFLLDEIDKLTRDAQGDPASALLEVLDPEQNHAFQDHYLELDYDLSRVLFLATANTLADIPEPLRDRMEVIRIPGYLLTEKTAIAQQFLLPGQLRRHGLLPGAVTLEDETIRWLVETYTREAGVRELDRYLARVARKLARSVAEQNAQHPPVGELLTQDRLRTLLGPPPILRAGREDQMDRIGIATGLAWTPAGGEILDIEAAVLPGSGKIQLTGTLGDVMKESAVAALTYARARASLLGLQTHFHQEVDVHIHIPEGGTPKEGPSAGAAMALALISALSQRPTLPDVALTGELTLRGRILPVGGIREKTVAALRQGIATVLIPADNAHEIETLPIEVRDGLQLIPVSTMDQVLALALQPLAAPGRTAGDPGHPSLREGQGSQPAASH